MTEIGFYHLTRTPIDRALPQILKKAASAGKRSLVRTGSEERVAVLNMLLWTYDPASFLPHGTLQDGDPADHPVFLSTSENNANNAEVLILTDGVEAEQPEAFERCLEMFDGGDPAAVDRARAHWRIYRDKGYSLTYWQQSETGGWEKKADG